MKLKPGTRVALTLTGTVESITTAGAIWIETEAGTGIAWRPGLDAGIVVTVRGGKKRRRVLDHARIVRGHQVRCRCGWRAPKKATRKHTLDPYTWHVLRELRRSGVLR